MTLRELIKWASDVNDDVLDAQLKIRVIRKIDRNITVDVRSIIGSIDENIDFESNHVILYGTDLSILYGIDL